MERLRVGYVPLTDAAVLIVAAARGFAAVEGIELQLVREVSWANIRDKLVFGHFDAAHMLAPLAVATTLGLGHVEHPLVAPFALSHGGNAVTVSQALADSLAGGLGDTGGDVLARPGDCAVTSRDRIAGTVRALGGEIRARAAAGRPPLTFATVFPFSTHTYLLRRLFVSAGLDPERDVRVVVVPPPLMVDALRRGHVDGFCVGSPWNGVAVEEGVGTIVLTGNDIVHRAPEKVLALPAEAAGAAHLVPLVRALAAAARWCGAPENHAELAALLAAPCHLDLPEAIVRRTLDGRLIVDGTGRVRADDEFLVLGRDNAPAARDADWLFGEMVAAGHLPASAYTAVREIYRADIAAAAGLTAG